MKITNFDITMDNPQAVILDEIANGVSQKSVALTYAIIIRQEERTADWPRINRAIMDRWSGRSSLNRIKDIAWKHVAEWGGAA